MHFSLALLSLLLFSTTLLALDTTKSIRTPIIFCQKDSECPSATHFCNIEQHVCTSKHSLNSSCRQDHECFTGKCVAQLCRRSCKEDNDCSYTKEYCSMSNYCKAKHCGSCLRDVHCANHHCQLFHCASNDCTIALKRLRQHR